MTDGETDRMAFSNSSLTSLVCVPKGLMIVTSKSNMVQFLSHGVFKKTLNRI